MVEAFFTDGVRRGKGVGRALPSANSPLSANWNLTRSLTLVPNPLDSSMSPSTNQIFGIFSLMSLQMHCRNYLTNGRSKSGEVIRIHSHGRVNIQIGSLMSRFY